MALVVLSLDQGVLMIGAAVVAAAAVARAMALPATPFTSNNKDMPVVSSHLPATPKQLPLDLGIEVERVVGWPRAGKADRQLVCAQGN